ncbi:MAG TPA: DinB family protein [Candidatus Limnocylindrales bacterium]|nr:DinB family protein [Candidatus Limnocylindrales bacterium]
MSEPNTDPSGLRAGLVDMLRAARAAERDVFAAVEPGVRDLPAVDGGWSAKDIQAHLSAWRRIQVARMAAVREGREEPVDAGETDEVNAAIHAERAHWPWDRVLADADATSRELIAEVEAASDATLANDRISGSIMGNGSEHTLAHLPGVATGTGLDPRVVDLADTVAEGIDRGGWPTRAAAYARYNLACFHALHGQLDLARVCLRTALVDREELRAFAVEDGDLIALRDEIPTLLDG